jgi:aspartyl-tRNA synthetase
MKLKKTSFIISLLGILLLLLLLNLQPSQTNIEDINKKLLNKKIKITGEVTETKNYTNFQIITIKDQTGKIKVFTEKQISLTNITVIGTVREYRDTLQLNAEKIVTFLE